MKRPAHGYWLLAGALALTGCTTGPASGPEPDPDNPVVDCGPRAFHAALRDNQATLYLPGLALSLPRKETQQGKRYLGNGYELWRKGDRVRVRTPDQGRQDCRILGEDNPWARAWLRGLRFRARGRDPDWLLEIAPGRQLNLQWDQDEPLHTVLPEASLRDDLVIYRQDTGEHRLRVEILEHPCRDNAGEEHSHAVRVLIDDQTLHGCGRGLAPVEAGP